ncbi:MAG: hypothetical protein AAF393_00150 [Pseudomonadota bacterium]
MASGWEILRGALAPAWQNPGAALRAVLFGLFVYAFFGFTSAVFETAEIAGADATWPPLLAVFLQIFGDVIAGVFVGVAWYRFVLMGELPPWIPRPALASLYWAVCGPAMILYLVSMLIGIAVISVLFLIVFVISEESAVQLLFSMNGLMSYDIPPPDLPVAAGLIVYAAMLVGVLVLFNFGLTMVHLSLATGTSLNFRSSWQRTRRLRRSIFVVALLVGGYDLLIQIIPPLTLERSFGPGEDSLPELVLMTLYWAPVAAIRAFLAAAILVDLYQRVGPDSDFSEVFD